MRQLRVVDKLNYENQTTQIYKEEQLSVSNPCNDLTLNLRFAVEFYRVASTTIHQLHLWKISEFNHIGWTIILFVFVS